MKLQDIYKKKQLETIKNIDTEITNYVAEYHSKEFTEKLLKHWEQKCKLTEARAKDEFEKKVEWFKENWKVEKANQKPQNLSHEINNEYKMKERRNPWKEQPKRKLNEKETSSDQLKRQQDQCSINDIESTPSDDTLVDTLDAVSNNNFDKDLENSFITNSSTTDQQPDHFFYRKTRLIRGERKKTQIYKNNDQNIFKKTKKLCKRQKKTQTVGETQPAPTNNKSHHTEENKYSQPKLFNLSSTTLSKCQTSILLRGLKFTPRPQSNSIQLTCDLKTFAHKLRLTEYFDDHNVTPIDQKNESLVKGKSIFYAPRNRNKELETHISFINNIDFINEKSNKKSNLSPKEWTELRNLMNQPDIVIKEVDKGGAVTVLSKNYYRAMIYEHLSNQNTYQKLNKNLDPTIMKKLKKLLSKHKSIFTDKEFEYLSETDYNTSNFFELPKIHKSQLITNAIKEQILKSLVSTNRRT